MLGIRIHSTLRPLNVRVQNAKKEAAKKRAARLQDEREREAEIVAAAAGKDTEEAKKSARKQRAAARSLAALGSIPILRGLTDMERERLSQALAKQSYPAGASIIAEGERGDSLFILSAGEAQAEVDGVGVVRQYTSGEWFGELALISGEPRKATVIATTECTMLRLQRVDFERLIGELATHMETLRRRFGTAAYSAGGQDYSKLFRHYDVDNTGFLDLDEFRAACRKGGQVKVSDVGEREIRCLYHLIDMMATVRLVKPIGHSF